MLIFDLHFIIIDIFYKKVAVKGMIKNLKKRKKCLIELTHIISVRRIATVSV